MPTVFRVVNWDHHFENNRTRDMRAMSWVPIPNKHDGDGYTELLDHKDGAAHFGAWVAILQVASKCDPRGTLLRRDRTHLRTPHDEASLARMTRIPAKVIGDAVVRLVKIGWLEAIPFAINEAQEGAEIPQEGAECPPATAQDPAWKGREGKVGNRTEEKGAPPDPAVMTFRRAGVDAEPYGLTQATIDTWARAYPNTDVIAELLKAQQWLTVNDRTDIPRFLVNWLNHSGKRGGNKPTLRLAGTDPDRQNAYSKVGRE